MTDMSQMTLPDLDRYIITLNTLRDAAAVINANEYYVEVSILPGDLPRITLPDFILPQAAISDTFVPEQTATAGAAKVAGGEGEQAAPPPPPDPIIDAAVEAAFGQVLPGYDLVENDAPEIVDVAPGAKSNWTDEDDTHVIEIVASHLQAATTASDHSEKRKLAIDIAAQVLNRDPFSVYCRYRATLEGRVYARVEELDREAKQPLPDSLPPMREPPAPNVMAPPVATGNPPSWTDDEDQRLIDIIARAVHGDGINRNKAAEAAALALRRPIEGTKFRTKNKLATRIDARIAELAAQDHSHSATAVPVQEAPAPAEGGGGSPNPLALAPPPLAQP
jgi:hypothetical protein